MNRKWRHKISLILMTSSLLLLLCFLLFWLKSSYDREIDLLKKETNFVFFDAINGVKEDAFQQILMRTATEKYLFDTTSLDLNFGQPKTSRGVISGLNISKRDSVLIFVNGEEGDGFPKGKSGTFADFLALSKGSSEQADSLPKEIPSMIMAKMDKLDGNFSVKINIQGKVDSSSSNLTTDSYTDIGTGEQISMQLSDFKGDILKKITPQILFSLLLFGITSMAFLLIYKNLEREKRLINLKNDFISNVTHELKTPITTVGVAIEALSNFDALKNPERTKEYLNISKQELNRLSILVDKVLKMSLFEEKEPELKLETLDLSQLIAGILNSLKLLFEKHNAQVSFENNGSNNHFKGDRIHLTNVIYNLIDNALKYSPLQPLIHLKLADNEEGVQLSICDKGMGIPKAYQDKIFDKFTRVPTGDEHNIKGYGLGLNYVKSIVEQHGGTIEVESVENQGTEFRIAFPV